MFNKFDRKMNKVEFNNTIQKLEMFFDNKEKAINVFTELMENGSYTWNTGRFVNRISLFYKTNVNVILHTYSLNNMFYNKLKENIEMQEGTDKQYFIYINYHKDPSVWRLNDMQCINGMVHPSYHPLSVKYHEIYEIMKQEEQERIKKETEQRLNNSVSQYVSFS